MTPEDIHLGMAAVWLKVQPGGYGLVTRVPVRVIAVSDQRIRIELTTKAGDRVQRSVRPSSLRFPDRAEAAAVNELIRDDARAGMILTSVTRLLGQYAFTPNDEAELQEAVAKVIDTAKIGVRVDREVIAERGRYDIALRPIDAMFPLVILELKVTGSAPAVERQAQRYALTAGVAAVAVVTTSNRLASQLRSGELGGKPFGVIALRTMP